MRIVYRDINTNAIKTARYFEFDYVTNHTIVIDENGNHLTLCQWQIVKRVTK